MNRQRENKQRILITLLYNDTHHHMNPPAKSFRDLIVWQKAREFVLLERLLEDVSRLLIAYAQAVERNTRRK